MINEGAAADTMWPDEWTVVTRDGKRSAQFEHTMIITPTGVELLSARVGTDRTSMAPWDEAYTQRPGAAAGASAASASSSSTSSGGGGGGP
jgi:hypothetical protein